MMTTASTMNFYDFAGLNIGFPPKWCDITDTLPEGSPFTLAICPDGVGALQFTIGVYVSGKLPKIDREVIQTLLKDFEATHPEMSPIDEVKEFQSTFVFGLGRSYETTDTYFRVWHLSDGLNVCFASYTCSSSLIVDAEHEVAEAEKMIRSITFID